MKKSNVDPNDIFLFIQANNITGIRELIAAKGKLHVDLDLRNESGETPLILAAKCGYTDIAKLLVDNGAKVDLTDSNGRTALYYAVYKSFTPREPKLIPASSPYPSSHAGDSDGDDYMSGNGEWGYITIYKDAIFKKELIYFLKDHGAHIVTDNIPKEIEQIKALCRCQSDDILPQFDSDLDGFLGMVKDLTDSKCFLMEQKMEKQVLVLSSDEKKSSDLDLAQQRNSFFVPPIQTSNSQYSSSLSSSSACSTQLSSTGLSQQYTDDKKTNVILQTPQQQVATVISSSSSSSKVSSSLSSVSSSASSSSSQSSSSNLAHHGLGLLFGSSSPACSTSPLLTMQDSQPRQSSPAIAVLSEASLCAAFISSGVEQQKAASLAHTICTSKDPDLAQTIMDILIPYHQQSISNAPVSSTTSLIFAETPR